MTDKPEPLEYGKILELHKKVFEAPYIPHFRIGGGMCVVRMDLSLSVIINDCKTDHRLVSRIFYFPSYIAGSGNSLELKRTNYLRQIADSRGLSGIENKKEELSWEHHAMVGVKGRHPVTGREMDFIIDPSLSYHRPMTIVESLFQLRAADRVVVRAEVGANNPRILPEYMKRQRRRILARCLGVKWDEDLIKSFAELDVPGQYQLLDRVFNYGNDFPVFTPYISEVMAAFSRDVNDREWHKFEKFVQIGEYAARIEERRSRFKEALKKDMAVQQAIIDAVGGRESFLESWQKLVQVNEKLDMPDKTKS